MTLDNLDGRQARRTGTSSPLGHLFDHGCDTLNVFITGLNTAAALRLGSNVRALLLVWGAGMALFFSATLEEYYNGALNLGFINGPNEGLLIMQIIYLVSAIFGSNVWTQEFAVGSYQFPVGNIFLYVLVPLATPTFIANYVSVGGSIPRPFRWKSIALKLFLDRGGIWNELYLFSYCCFFANDATDLHRRMAERR